MEESTRATLKRPSIDERKAVVQSFHFGDGTVTESALAAALGISSRSSAHSPDLLHLLRRLGNHNFSCDGTSFTEIREIFHTVHSCAKDAFADAGAGIGHFVIYGAMLGLGNFTALEIVPGRCQAIRRAVRLLKLANLKVIECDAVEARYEQLRYVFVNNPFFGDATQRFVRRLKYERQSSLTVIAINNIVDAFREDRDFIETPNTARIAAYRFGIFDLR